jgi:hypothetical protein
MTEWTTVNLEKPTANRLRKSAIDFEQDIREHATLVVEEGLKVLRSRRHNNTNPQKTQSA